MRWRQRREELTVRDLRVVDDREGKIVLVLSEGVRDGLEELELRRCRVALGGEFSQDVEASFGEYFGS